MRFSKDITIGEIPTASNSNYSALFQADGQVRKRTLGSIITQDIDAYLSGISVAFPTSIFNVADTSITPTQPNLVVSLKNQLAGTVFAAPETLNGTPSFRKLTDSDLSETSVFTQLGNFVPYIGATQDVDLGEKLIITRTTDPDAYFKVLKFGIFEDDPVALGMQVETASPISGPYNVPYIFDFSGKLSTGSNSVTFNAPNEGGLTFRHRNDYFDQLKYQNGRLTLGERWDYVNSTHKLRVKGNGIFTSTLESTGFIKTGSNDNYVLLGGGGHKLVSDFALSTDIPDVSGFVPSTRTITAGNGLSGGGTLAANRTITLGTPSSIGLSTTNSVTSTSHTHSLDAATITAINNGQTAFGWGDFRDYGLGIKVDHNSDANDSRLWDNGFYTLGAASINRPSYISSSYASGILTISETSTRRVQIATGGNQTERLSFRSITDSTQGNWLEFIHTGNLDSQATSLGFIKSSALSGYVPTSRTITAGNGLSGGGNLTANRTITLGTPSPVGLSTTNSVTSTSHTHALDSDTITEINKGQQALTNIGTLSSLTTTDKSNLVNAINEVKGSVPNVTGLVPYTGANQPINLNTQDLTTGGYTNRLHSYFERINLASNSTDVALGNFKLLTNVAAAGIGNASSQTGDIIITLPITTTTLWQAEIDILREGNRATLNIGGYGTNNAARFVNVVYGNINDILEVKFGRIENSTVLIIKRSNSTIHRLQVNISKFYYHHTNSVNLYDDKSKYKVEYVNESDLVGFTLNGTITNAQFTRDSYLWNKGDFSQTDINNWNTAFGWGNHSGKYLSNTITDLGYTELFSGDLNTLPNGSYVQAISASSSNGASGIGTPRSLISFGARNLSDSILQSDILIGTEGFAVRNRTNNIWRTSWHTGNLNPAQYVLQTSLNTQLANYVPINGVTTINNTKTFTSSPVVPNATLNNHAVNLGQLNTILDEYATEDWVTQEINNISIPTVNNGQLSLSTGTGLSGSASFTANQSGNSSFSVSIASTHKLPTVAEWNALPTTDTITRLRGTTSGTYTSGDLTLLAGSNVSISQSGSNFTINATDTNTTYSAGTGLSLTGTTFGQTITTSGTGTFVQSITQTTNGFQVNLGTPPNTTYSAGTLALLQEGTNISNRVWSAKVIADYVTSMIPTNTDSILSYTSANGIIVTDWNSYALSEYAMSLGYGSVTSGNYATSVGGLLSTTGFGSTNQGYSNSITKPLGYALGAYNSVRATLSGAFGIGLINKNDGAFVVGRYNAELPVVPYDTTSPHTQAVFAIGAGRDDIDRYTALTVYGDGRADYAEGYNDSNWTDNTLVTKKWVLDNAGGSSGGGEVGYRNVYGYNVFDLSSEYSPSLAESVFHVMTDETVVFIGGQEVFHNGYKVTIMTYDISVDISLDNTQGVNFINSLDSSISYLDKPNRSITFIYDKDYSSFRVYHVSDLLI